MHIFTVASSHVTTVMLILSISVAVLSIAAAGIGASAIIKYYRLKKVCPPLASVMYSLLGQVGSADVNIEPQYVKSITCMFKMHRVALRLTQWICILIVLVPFCAMLRYAQCKTLWIFYYVSVVGAVSYYVVSRRVRRVDGALKRLAQQVNGVENNESINVPKR